HSLGKKTIAEYVEDAAILRFLYESGIDYVQGHFLSPPMDISNIAPQAVQQNHGNKKQSTGKK
ncbi:MAG: EAL domain-containing protein, partial [Candidatus Thiodiazotropha sp. (ex Cardiolucina cf. quadrata)]|nr:EAL domain-containing protein [Candidatus Thiodiazotropha sp. (ex Cardiolucina cf. quadrata)]